MKSGLAIILLAALFALTSCATSSQPAKAKEITVYVMGEVNAPGKYLLPLGSRVSDAVAKAGGIDRVGSHDSIYLTRKEAEEDRQRYRVDLTGKVPGRSDDMLLRDEDAIFVPAAFGEKPNKAPEPRRDLSRLVLQPWPAILRGATLHEPRQLPSWLIFIKMSENRA